MLGGAAPGGRRGPSTAPVESQAAIANTAIRAPILSDENDMVWCLLERDWGPCGWDPMKASA